MPARPETQVVGEPAAQRETRATSLPRGDGGIANRRTDEPCRLVIDSQRGDSVRSLKKAVAAAFKAPAALQAPPTPRAWNASADPSWFTAPTMFELTRRARRPRPCACSRTWGQPARILFHTRTPSRWMWLESDFLQLFAKKNRACDERKAPVPDSANCLVQRSANVCFGPLASHDAQPAKRHHRA